MLVRLITSALFVALAINITSAVQPEAAAPLRPGGQATTLHASGSINEVNKRTSNIAFFSDAPFWGAPRSGYGRAVLWPKGTAFVLNVPAPTPITVDKKNARFEDLRVGQQIDVQYNFNEGDWGIVCVAYRIDAHSATGTFSLSGESLRTHLAGHWRTASQGFLMDYWISRDGTFRAAFASVDGHGDYSGKWSSEPGAVHFQITNSNTKMVPAGSNDQGKIRAVANDYFVLEGRWGQNQFLRVKD
jgi:hypothetical protein